MPALLKFSFLRYIAVSSILAWATEDPSQKGKKGQCQEKGRIGRGLAHMTKTVL